MSLPPPKTDFSELRRRQGISKAGIVATPADVDTVKASLGWNDASQRYALVNLANRDQRPKSVYPAFRVLGLFPSVEAASTFARQYALQLQSYNIFLVETCKWNLIPKSSTASSPEDCFAKVESLLIAYYKNVVLDKLAFDKRRHENTSTVVEENVFENPGYPVAVRELEKRGVTLESFVGELHVREAEEKQQLLQKFQGTETKTEPPAQVAAPPPQNVEFTETLFRADEDNFTHLPDGQKYLLFSIMNDEEEPAFCVYGALPTLQESKGYQHYVLKKEAPTHDNNCYELGHWIYPESAKQMDKLGLSTYPVDEQNRIMKWHHENKNKPYDNMPGIDILADRKIDEEGKIVELSPAEAAVAAEDVKKEEN